MRNIATAWATRLRRGVGFAARLPASHLAVRTGRALLPPTHVRFFLGPACNLACGHCAFHGDGRPVSFADYRRVVDELWALGARALTLTGGEPTLVDGFPDYVAHAVDQGWTVEWETNGTTLSGRLLARLAAAGAQRVVVSLDGCEASHDAVRGPGTFRDAMAGLDNLLAAIDPARTQVRLDTVLMRHNVDDVLTLHAEAVRRRVWLHLVPFTVESWTHHQPSGPDVGWALDDAATDRLAALLPAWLDARARHGWWWNPRRHLEEMLYFARTGRSRRRCLVGARQLNVDERLRVGFCTDAIGVVGDLTTQSVRDVWDGAAAAAARRQVGTCDACVLGSFYTPTLWEAGTDLLPMMLRSGGPTGRAY